MPSTTQSTSSTLDFDSGPDPVALVIDGVLVDGGTIYTVTSSTLAFADDETGDESFLVADELVLEDIICVNQDYTLSTSSSIEFEDGATWRFGSFLDFGPGNGTGLADPPTGFVFTVVKKRRLSDTIDFRDSITVEGGYILDLTCNPPTLVLNVASDDWGTFTDSEWDEFDDLGWSVFGD